MNLSKYLISLFIAFALVFAACSDDNGSDPNDDDNNNNNTGGDDYFPEETGSYWILETYQLDQQNQPVSGTIQIDSMIVSGNVNILGKDADYFIIYDSNNEVKSEKYFYQTENNSVYIHSDFINEFLDELGGGVLSSLPFDLGNRWIKIADFGESSWAVFDTTFEDFQFINDIMIDGSFSVSGHTGIQKNIEVGSQSFSSQEFILTFDFEGFISVDPSNEKQFSFNIHHWFGKGVGLILTTYESTIFDFGLGTYPFTGKEEKVIRFNIKN